MNDILIKNSPSKELTEAYDAGKNIWDANKHEVMIIKNKKNLSNFILLKIL